MVKVVIFDIDGVLIAGSNEVYFECYHKAIEAVGVRLRSEEEKKRILEIWGKGYKFQLQHILREYPNLLPKAIKVYEACRFRPDFYDKVRLIDGVKDTLLELAKNYTLAIASGMVRDSIDVLLGKYAIRDYFKVVISSSEIENPDDKKPAPYMLNKIVKDFGVEKHEALYVGDGESDVVMARNAGVTPIVVLTGHLNKEEAEALKVEYIIPDITYLPKILIKLEP